MPGLPQTDRAHRRTEQQIFIDRPVDAVWKRVADLRTFTSGLARLRVHDATPNGDTVCGEVTLSVAPWRVRFAGTAAVVDIDESLRRVAVRVDARDHFGRGKVVAGATFSVNAVGSGAEVTLIIDTEVAGAVVRHTGSALLDELDTFARTCFVALADDVFAPEETVANLFEMPVYGLVDAHGRPQFDEPEPEIDLTNEIDLTDEPATAFARFVDALNDERPAPPVDIDLVALERPAAAMAASAPPAAAFATFLDAVPSVDLVFEATRHHDVAAAGASDPHELHFDPTPVNPFARAAVVWTPTSVDDELLAEAVEAVEELELLEEVVAPTFAPTERTSSSPVSPVPTVRRGLPQVSLPRPAGISGLRHRGARVAQTAGTVAAGAVVVAAVAGAVVARRWFGRR